ncbi:MAG TPA: transcription-repair coupling factor [Spirochaetota bacterium]|nr:transcription-repair coupling factor [Spirochaetota bacterium]
MLLKPIIDSYISSREYNEFLERLDNQDSTRVLEGISRASFPLLCSSCLITENKSIFAILPTPQLASDFAADCAAFIEEELIYRFPSPSVLPYEFLSPSEHISRERIRALYRLLSAKPALFIADTEAVLRLVPTPERLKRNILIFEKDEEYPFDDVIETLVKYGYKREITVNSYGCFAVKGGIIDIFPPETDEPVRLDFFGDTLESIRYFDLESQVSRDNIDHISIYPRNEFLLSSDERQTVEEYIKKSVLEGKKIPEHISEFVEGSELPDGAGIEDLLPHILGGSTIQDYINETVNLIIVDPPEVSAKRNSIENTYRDLYTRKSARELTVPVESLISFEALTDLRQKAFIMQSFTSTPGSLRFGLKSIPTFHGKITALKEDLAERIQNGWKIFISTAFEGQLRRLSDLLQEFKPATDEDKSDSSLVISLSSYSEGFEMEATKTLLLTDHDIFGKSYRRKRSFKRRTSQPLKSFLDLAPGDYVVHINHGIGVFRTIERMSAGGFERDFLMIEYADGDKLFVALDQLNMIQKYTGVDGKIPRIDSLGKKSAWNRIKKRVQESVEELAGELIEVYARRKALKGYQYPPDTLWQEEFEARFEYEETPDQLNAIEDVKDDMESSQPMDRLICGDVGFGKTEVAIRAAFKAAMAGKQTAILVPTTILAMQHYKNFLKRFSDYPVAIELISRFRSRKQINDTKSRMAGGDVDIVIGTHALLAKDIVFKNLGLLIIDEEQRFGVKHKERLKELRTQVDVMTMSATPIPRTLHMSMAGIRDLSTIMTAPENRQSIETYVMEENPDILQLAIRNELERGGQIFFIHNRVQTIDTHAALLSELVPEASIAVAHGQMNEHELEDILIDFLNKKYNILVATTILESGIDMPDVNTIIINRADTFGLSQLYQLKGRVGRSSLKGFAYLFYPRHVPLNEVAQKRLRVISEYTDLGSGFKIAMKDMEIRGAGNLLGKQQSGNIMDVGFDLYCQMLEDAVSRLKGERHSIYFRTPLFIKTDNYIPDEYISDQRQKIEFYKRFESCETLEEIDRLTTEMKDRFGHYPEQVSILIQLETIRCIASNLYIEEILEGETSIRIRISEQTKISTEKLLEVVKTDDRIMADPQNSDTLIFKTSEKETEKKLIALKKWLHDLC